MAVIGQSLPTPEEGWQRVNCGSPDTEKKFKFTGSWIYSTIGAWYEHDAVVAEPADNIGQEYRLEFSFIGSRLRFIHQTWPTRSKKVDVYIDGKYTGSYAVCGSGVSNALLYEKTGLEYKLHYVKLLNADVEGTLDFDCMDIDADGNVPEFVEPEYFLFKDGSSYKTITGDGLTVLENKNVTKENFQQYGFQDLQQVKEIYGQLGQFFQLLCLSSQNANESIRITHLPPSQLILAVEDIDLSAYQRISQISLSTTGAEGSVRVVFSFDRGKTWNTFIEGTWQEITLSVDAVQTDGIAPEALSAIPSEKWNEMNTGTLRIACCLSKAAVTNDMAVDALTITGDTASWKKAKRLEDYNCLLTNSTTMTIQFLTDGSYKINYMEAKQ